MLGGDPRRRLTETDMAIEEGDKLPAVALDTPDGGTISLRDCAGKPFVLTTRAAPGCSDGMSDRSYPLAVTLTVAGEKRTGCAAPL